MTVRSACETYTDFVPLPLQYFLVGFLAWTADAFDFHALSIQTTKLADYYDTSNTAISTAITLTLLLRSVGAAMLVIPMYELYVRQILTGL